jgi:hypothetical protein
MSTSFASWLGPHQPTAEWKQDPDRANPQSVNRATVAFRNAAMTLLRSQSYLGAQYRHLRTSWERPKP